MNDLVLVSYYTDLLYGKYARRLAASAEKFGLAHDIQPVPDRGSWQVNNLYKPTFIRLAAAAHPKSCILWVDADAEIVQDPIMLKTQLEYDFAAYYPEANRPWAGTLFWNNTPAAHKALDVWEDHCNGTPAPDMDQDVLPYAVYKQPGFRILHLPPAYCWVEKIHRPNHGDTRPVIEHYTITH